MSASEQKQDEEKYYDMRLSMLGDAFSIYSFVNFAVALSRRFLPQMPIGWTNGDCPGVQSQL